MKDSATNFTSYFGVVAKFEGIGETLVLSSRYRRERTFARAADGIEYLHNN
jgi:hypothetical protein